MKITDNLLFLLIVLLVSVQADISILGSISDSQSLLYEAVEAVDNPGPENVRTIITITSPYGFPTLDKGVASVWAKLPSGDAIEMDQTYEAFSVEISWASPENWTTDFSMFEIMILPGTFAFINKIYILSQNQNSQDFKFEFWQHLDILTI